jgi:hypothetical protein
VVPVSAVTEHLKKRGVPFEEMITCAGVEMASPIAELPDSEGRGFQLCGNFKDKRSKSTCPVYPLYVRHAGFSPMWLVIHHLPTMPYQGN